MKVILLKDVPKLGRKDEIKDVNEGHAQNFLIPRGLVKVATVNNVNDHRNKIIEKEAHRKVQDELAAKALSFLDGKVLDIICQSNDNGNLYKAIHERDIISLIKKTHNIDIKEKDINLGQIKEVGEYDFNIKIGDKVASMRLSVKN